jgi:glycine/D-amino acid oxidase-like deaminating enzyme
MATATCRRSPRWPRTRTPTSASSARGSPGLTTAYLLGREGEGVVVLDDGPIGGGETGRTTAHLASALDDRFTELERLHGEIGAKLAAESHAAAIDRIEAIVRDEHIDCDFERLDGFLFNPRVDRPTNSRRSSTRPAAPA